MIQLATKATTPVVCLPEEKNLDKQLSAARIRAQREHTTFIIERTLTRRDGSARRIPILEITPKGDLLEVPAPRLRVSLGARFDWDMSHKRVNNPLTDGRAVMSYLMKMSREYLAAEAEYRQQNSRNKNHQRAARRNANTTTMLSERAARKDAA